MAVPIGRPEATSGGHFVQAAPEQFGWGLYSARRAEPGPILLATRITPANAELLRGGLDEWLPDVASGLPMCAAIVDGRAVSLCASVDAARGAHAAGVETLPAYRGRGLASQAVAAWAQAVLERGRRRRSTQRRSTISLPRASPDVSACSWSGRNSR